VSAVTVMQIYCLVSQWKYLKMDQQQYTAPLSQGWGRLSKSGWYNDDDDDDADDEYTQHLTFESNCNLWYFVCTHMHSAPHADSTDIIRYSAGRCLLRLLSSYYGRPRLLLGYTGNGTQTLRFLQLYNRQWFIFVFRIYISYLYFVLYFYLYLYS